MCDKKYVPLHCHSHYSLLDGLSTPQKIVQRCKDIGSPCSTLTDHGNIAGWIELQKSCKKLGIKPIYGIELYVCENDPSIKTNENNKRNHLTILAKNNKGIKSLIKLVSESNRPDYFYRKPRLDLKNISNFTKNGELICLSGCLAGELSEKLFTDMKKACMYGADLGQIQNVRNLLNPNWKNIAQEIIEKYIKIFGKENYFIELQSEGMVSQIVTVECLREIAKAFGIPTVATLDSHYTCKGDADDQRILLYSQMRTTQEEQDRLRKNGEDTMAFFYLENFYIFSYEEMAEFYSQKEIEQTLIISDMIKSESLGRQPCLPKYDVQKNISSDEYIKELCINKAKEKFKNFTQDKKKIYWDRLKSELSVIEEAELADYFLIVYDACKFIDDNKAPRGKGRGSGAGSLVNYLLNITQIDPIEYNLYFERFYNVSRSIPTHFDVGPLKFTQWLSDNYGNITKEQIEQARFNIVNLVRANIRNYKLNINNKLLKEERDWIDKNNPKMWLYIEYCSQQVEFSNPNNSHIAEFYNTKIELKDGKHKVEIKIDINKPVKINEGHISLPDIDTDIGVEFREKVIEYLINRWGEDRVSQMVTFGKLMGKAALKEVFRSQPDLVKHLMKVKAEKEGKDPNDINITPFDLCNEITSLIPDEASIIDELQHMRDETDEDYTILNWAIDNIDKMKEYYQWFKPLFDTAMRLEGTKKNQSKHAAGLVISDIPIKELVPLVYDPKNKTRVVGFEMGSAEACGCVKFDLLGVVCLDKMWYCQKLINGE
jgi:DNA polymerase III alpha subunit